jgi:hypothetical protein
MGLAVLLAAAPTALGEDHGRIAGRVVGGPDAVALAEARVQLHRFDPGTGNWPQFSTAFTDVDGRYRFGELAAGRYRACADSTAGIDPTIRSPCTCRAAGRPRRRSTRPTRSHSIPDRRSAEWRFAFRLAGGSAVT